MADPNARDAKLIQYLNEAYGKEKQLETSLQAHITMTTRAPYKKRLQQHLKETKGHARQVERRIKKLGGAADGNPVPGGGAVAEVADAVQTVARKGAAAAQGPLHAVRGTGEQEKLLKNAKTEYQDEAEEIATYTAIETLAESVGDKETAQLAKGIRREEERMAKFLEKQIPMLTKAVAQDEIPSELRSSSRRRRSSARSSSSRSASARKSSARKSSARKSSARKSSARGSSSRASSSRSSSGRASSSRGSSSRPSSSRSSSSRGGSSRGRRSSPSRSGSRSSGGRSSRSSR